MTQHMLKTWPNYFRDGLVGQKTFEIRIDDRGYQKGDTVRLDEWDRNRDCSCAPAGGGRYEHRTSCEKYTGRTITATIGCVMASTPPKGSQRGFFGNGYVVFSLVDPVNAGEARPPLAAVLDPIDAMRRVAAAGKAEA